MSRAATSDTSSSSHSRIFPFRSRTAPAEETKHKKLNSLFRFSGKEDSNQLHPPCTPGTAEHDRGSKRGLDDDDDDSDDDEGTVHTGFGRYTLRVINPDPSSSESEDEEDQDNNNNVAPNSSAPSTSSITRNAPPPPPQFLTSAPSPSASSLSLNTHSTPLVRRESKTLHDEQPTTTGVLEWLPPLDLSPVEWNLLDEQNKRASKLVLGTPPKEDQQQQQQQQQQQHRILPDRLLVATTRTVTPSITASSSVLGAGGPRSTAHESVLTSSITTRAAAQSKYSKASYSLTHDRDTIRLYREMAEKTKDTDIQLNYAKYLLEVASLFGGPSSGHHTPTLVMKRGGRLKDNEAKRRALEDEGVRWIRRLAKRDVGEAAYMLATWIEQQKYGIRRNPGKAFRYFEVAAASGRPEAMYAVGKYHERMGNGSEAVKHYKAAAERGLVDAVHRLAQVYLHGQLGQRQNMTTGLALLAQAAEHATESSPEPVYTFAQVLANIYPKAEIPTELVEPYGGVHAAVRLFERAADWGHVKAQTQIGYIYEHGLYGAPVDYAKALLYYEKAARDGRDGDAMLGLSRLYNGGYHGPEDEDMPGWSTTTTTSRDEDASFQWCEKAAAQGIDKALYLLGWYYEVGFGTPRDEAKAFALYRRAALKGHQGAMARLENTKDQQQPRRDPQPCKVM